jgi:hypothetical protein
MPDNAKWKSVAVRSEDYDLLKELADFRSQKISTVLTDIIYAQWDKTFPPKKPLPETPHGRPKNPFLFPDN